MTAPLPFDDRHGQPAQFVAAPAEPELVVRHTRSGSRASFDLFLVYRGSEHALRGTWVATSPGEEDLLVGAFRGSGFRVDYVTPTGTVPEVPSAAGEAMTA